MTMTKFLIFLLLKAIGVGICFNIFFITSMGVELLQNTKHNQVETTAPVALTEPAALGGTAPEGLAMKDEGEYWTVQIRKPKNVEDLHSISSTLIGLTN